MIGQSSTYHNRASPRYKRGDGAAAPRRQPSSARLTRSDRAKSSQGQGQKGGADAASAQMRPIVRTRPSCQVGDGNNPYIQAPSSSRLPWTALGLLRAPKSKATGRFRRRSFSSYYASKQAQGSPVDLDASLLGGALHSVHRQPVSACSSEHSAERTLLVVSRTPGASAGDREISTAHHSRFLVDVRAVLCPSEGLRRRACGLAKSGSRTV